MSLSVPLSDGTYFEQLRSEHMADKLKAVCRRSSQKAIALELGVSQQYLSDVLHGRREFPDVIAKQMGYERVVTFVKWGGSPQLSKGEQL